MKKRYKSYGMIGKKHSPETRMKKADALRGAKSHFWKGGVTSKNQIIRDSLEYKNWRKAVFERDGYACIWGGIAHGNKLQADHIKSFSQYPELRLDINNGRTLCRECHFKTDTYANKAKLICA